MDNQQRFQNSGPQDQDQDKYQQSGFDNSGTADSSNPSYNQTSTGTGYGNTDDGTTQQYGDRDNRNTGAYPTTRESVPGSGFDNNAPNFSDKPGGYNQSTGAQSGGDYTTSTGTGSGGDYTTGNTGIDDSAFNKPSAGDKMRGSAEKMMGKMTGNPTMQERGHERKTGNLNEF